MHILPRGPSQLQEQNYQSFVELWGKGRAGVGCPVSIIEIHLILELRHHFAPQSSAVSLSFYSFFIFHPAALQISRVAVKEISSKLCLSVPSTL